MKKIFLSSLVFIFITNLTYAQTLNVDFKWMKKHLCNNTSPELKIENIPKGTVELRINMIDHHRRESTHGGGVMKRVFHHHLLRLKEHYKIVILVHVLETDIGDTIMKFS